MPASIHPTARSISPPPASTEPVRDARRSDEDDDASWVEESAVFELPAPVSTAQPLAIESEPSAEDVGRLFSNYRAYVAKIGRRYLSSRAEVDDLIQDVFLATVRDIHKVKDPARLRAWLATVTTRMAKRRRFRSSIHPVASDGLESLSELPNDEGPGPESTADLLGNIEKLLSLPDELRTPWLLKHLEGHTLEDVARQCDVSLSTAARRIQTVSERLGRRR
jgi:RNA polymerase sigma-70 factor (ECF subfamily)